jgi:hypothetical protein
MHSKTPLNYELESRASLEAHPRFASTLSNGLDVLKCFSAAEPQLGNKEIAEMLGLTRPTVSRLTFTLVGLGYLRRDERTGKYSLGPAVLTLGYPLLVHLTLRQGAGVHGHPRPPAGGLRGNGARRRVQCLAPGHRVGPPLAAHRHRARAAVCADAGRA